MVIAFACGRGRTDVTAGAFAQAPQQLKMRIQTAVPSASIYFELMKRFGGHIDKMSAGRLKVEILPDGAVVPAFEILDAVDKGIVEGGYAWTHYWSGKHPAAGLFSNPMAGAGVGLDQLSHVAWLYEGGGNELLQKLEYGCAQGKCGRVHGASDGTGSSGLVQASRSRAPPISRR